MHVPDEVVRDAANFDAILRSEFEALAARHGATLIGGPIKAAVADIPGSTGFAWKCERPS